MTLTDLQLAKEALLRECNTVQRELLGKLADVAADMGEVEMEAGYRWMAERGMWPAYCWKDDKTEPRWDFDDVSDSAYLRSHEVNKQEIPGAVNIAMTTAFFPSAAEAIEEAAKSIGEWLSEKLNGEEVGSHEDLS